MDEFDGLLADELDALCAPRPEPAATVRELLAAWRAEAQTAGEAGALAYCARVAALARVVRVLRK